MTEWIAYAELEPFGTGIEDQRMGMICSTIMNAFISVYSQSKNPKWYAPNDFIPEYGKEQEVIEKKQQSVEEMKDVLMAIAGKNKW